MAGARGEYWGADSASSSQELLRGAEQRASWAGEDESARRWRVERAQRAVWDAHATGWVVGGPRRCAPDRCMHFPGGIFYFPSPSADDSRARASTGVRTQGWAHATQLLAAAGKGSRRLSSEVGVQDSRVEEHKGPPADEGREQEMWRGLEKKSIKARAADKGRASLSSRPAPASSAASARLTCHRGWRPARAPLCCVGNCSSPGGGAAGEGAAKGARTQPKRPGLQPWSQWQH